MHLGPAPSDPLHKQGTWGWPGWAPEWRQSYSSIPRADWGWPREANRMLTLYLTVGFDEFFRLFNNNFPDFFRWKNPIWYQIKERGISCLNNSKTLVILIQSSHLLLKTYHHSVSLHCPMLQQTECLVPCLLFPMSKSSHSFELMSNFYQSHQKSKPKTGENDVQIYITVNCNPSAMQHTVKIRLNNTRVPTLARIDTSV